MGTFNYNHYNNKFYIFDNDEDAKNFYYSQNFENSKIFKDEKIFDRIGFVELVFSGGYCCGGSLDYISILDYFNYNSEKQDKKNYFHEFFNDVIKTENLKKIHKYTKKDIRTKKDLKDFIIKVFDEMIKQDIEKAKKELKYIAENFGAVYIQRTGTYTYEIIK